MSPLGYMIEVKRNQNNTIEMRLEAAKSAAPYVHARLHAAEIAEVQDDMPEDHEILERIEAILSANPPLRALLGNASLLGKAERSFPKDTAEQAFR